MNVRSLLAAVTGIAFFLMVSIQDLSAAPVNAGPAEKIHVVAGAELHDAVLASSAEAAAARKYVQGFLARSEVGTQIERMGFDLASISSRVALLNDSELLRLQSQMMTVDQQIRTAGIPGWAIALIAVGAAVGTVIIILAMIIAHNE
jgi:hypothetical protein